MNKKINLELNLALYLPHHPLNPLSLLYEQTRCFFFFFSKDDYCGGCGGTFRLHPPQIAAWARAGKQSTENANRRFSKLSPTQ